MSAFAVVTLSTVDERKQLRPKDHAGGRRGGNESLSL